MNNIFTKISIIIVMAITVLGSNIALAVGTSDIDSKLLPNITGSFEQEQKPELAAVGELPRVDFPEVAATVIKYILSLAMVFTFVALIVSAIFYLTAQGEEENIKKAKDIVIYLIIGMGIMAAAYAITIGISQFQFLS
jgi:hypothetical protein